MVPSAATSAPAWDRIESSGAKTVRVEFNWKRDFYGGGSAASCPSSPTPSSGFSWNRTDNLMRLAALRGITVLPYLTGSFCSQGYPEPGSAEMTAWNTFVEDLADRYGPGGTFWAGDWDLSPATPAAVPIETWEVGNEPNLPENNPSGILDPQKFGKFLIESSASIKTAQAGAEILLGGLATPDTGPSSVATYLGDLYDPDPLSGCCVYTASQLNAAYDGVSLHPYAVTQDGNQTGVIIAASRTALNANTSAFGANKPLWITEISWPIGDNVITDCSSTSRTNYSGFVQRRNLKQAFDWMVANYAGSADLKLASWHTETDNGATCGSGGSIPPANANQVYWKGQTGLITPSWSRRPAWCAYVAYTSARDCASGPGLYSSPKLDMDAATWKTMTAYVNDKGGISYSFFDPTTGLNFEGADLSVSGASAASEPGVSQDPGTGQTRIIYRTTTGQLGIWQKASWTGAWSHTTLGSAGDISANTSPGVYRAGSSAAGTLVTFVVYRGSTGNLVFRAETVLGWTAASTVAGSISANTSPAVTRSASDGTTVIVYRNTSGQVGMTTWTTAFGWTTSTLGAANSVDVDSSPAIGRDPGTGLQVVPYRNSSDVLAAHTLASGSFFWGHANSGATMPAGTEPQVAIDDVHGSAMVPFTNSSNGISVWNLGSGGTWTGPSAVGGTNVGLGTNPALSIIHSGLAVDQMIMPMVDGSGTFLAQQLAYVFGTGSSWDPPHVP